MSLPKKSVRSEVARETRAQSTCSPSTIYLSKSILRNRSPAVLLSCPQGRGRVLSRRHPPSWLPKPYHYKEPPREKKRAASTCNTAGQMLSPKRAPSLFSRGTTKRSGHVSLKQFPNSAIALRFKAKNSDRHEWSPSILTRVGRGRSHSSTQLCSYERWR